VFAKFGKGDITTQAVRDGREKQKRKAQSQLKELELKEWELHFQV